MARPVRLFLAFLGCALSAAGLGWFAVTLLTGPGSGAPVWWPPAGLGALVLLFGPRRLWGVFITGMLTGMLVAVLLIGPDLVHLAGVSAGLTENVAVALLLRRARPRTASEESLLDAVRVLALLMVATLFASVVFALVAGLGEATPMQRWWEFVRNHLLALMLVAPLLTVGAARGRPAVMLRGRRDNLEWAAQTGVTVALSALVFLTRQQLLGSAVLVLPLIWVALRLGPVRATVALWVVASLATIGTSHGLGRIAAVGSGEQTALALQAALAVLALTTMVISVVARMRERIVTVLRQRTHDLATAEEMAGLGSLRWEPGPGTSSWSAGLHALLGTDPAVTPETVRSFEERVHPADYPKVHAETVRMQREGGRSHLSEYRIVRTDGQVRHVAVQTRAEPVASGEADRVFATVLDITARHAAAVELMRAHVELATVLGAVTGTAILGTDSDNDTIRFFNRGAEQMFGYRAEEVIDRMSVMTMYDAHEQEELSAAGIDIATELGRAISSRGQFAAQRRCVRRDGSVFPVQMTVTPKFDESGDLIGFVGVITDLTEVLRAQEELGESEQRFRLAFDASPMGMAIVGLGAGGPACFLRVNEALCRFAGMTAEQLRGSPLLEFLPDPEQRKQALAELEGLRQGRTDTVNVERRLRRSDGAQLWGRLSGSVVRPGRGRDPYLILLIEDVTARRALTDQLQHEAAHDALTGLPNRLHLHRQLDRELREQATGAVAVLYLDLDGFKAVNDEQGHMVGDELLVQVADRIAATVRSSDVVARLGGDEFAVLCPGVPDTATALRIARGILQALSHDFDLSSCRARIGASIGVAVAVDGDTGPELLHAADQAMYSAKREGKGRVRLTVR